MADDWSPQDDELGASDDESSVQRSVGSLGSRGISLYYSRDFSDDESTSFQIDENSLPVSIQTDKDGPMRSPLRAALSLLQKMGSNQLPKSKGALVKALKPVCTVVAYTPLSVVLEKLKKTGPDLFGVQYAVVLGERNVRRLSNLEQDVLDLALKKAKAKDALCPVQIALPFTKRGKEMQEAVAKSALLASGKDLKKHMNELMELCVQEVQIHPERALLQYLLTSSFLIADSELEFFRVTRCANPLGTRQALTELNAAYVKAAKLHFRECRNGDMRQHEISMHALQYTKSMKSNSQSALDGRLRTLRPEAVPALLHLLTLVENNPENVFTRSEILEEISGFCQVIYVCSPVAALGFRAKDDVSVGLSSQFGRDPQRRPKRRKGSLYDPIVSSQNKSFPQFVTLHYNQLLPEAQVQSRGSTSWRQASGGVTDANFESRYTFRDYTLKHLQQLCRKRNASLVINNQEYAQGHVTKLQAFLRSLEVAEKVHKSDVCRMIFTGMTRANFLRRLLYCCFSVHTIDAEDLIVALKAVHKIRVERDGGIKFNY